MATLIKQKRYYYLQFYSGQSRPKRKRAPLKTARKSDALRIKALLESRYSRGLYDPWNDRVGPPTWETDAVNKLISHHYVIVNTQ